jgi:hypothetical protein
LLLNRATHPSSATHSATPPSPNRRPGRRGGGVGRQGGHAAQGVRAPQWVSGGRRLAQQHHVCVGRPGRLHRRVQAVRQQAAAALAGGWAGGEGWARARVWVRRWVWAGTLI